jgi:ATP-dependent Clp protease ATP-binding subunit ClpC
MFERFTDRARRVVVLSQEEARLMNHTEIGAEHLVLACLREGEGIAALALGRCGVTLEDARARVEAVRPMGAVESPTHIPFTRQAKKALELSLREALEMGCNYIGTEHILLGLVREAEHRDAAGLEAANVPPAFLRETIMMMLRGDEESGKRPLRVDLTAGPPADPVLARFDALLAEIDERLAELRAIAKAMRAREAS